MFLKSYLQYKEHNVPCQYFLGGFMNFSKKLKQLRLMLNCTQAQMAEFLGITVRGYRNYELGAREPELSVLIKLADHFNVSLDELVGRKFPKDSLMDSK